MWHWGRHTKSARSRARAREPRWIVEALEPRILLSAITWTGKGDGSNWTDPNNWSGDVLPASADDVTINLASNPTIQLSSGSQSVNSVTSTDPLQITGGTLQIATSLQSSANITLAGGTIQGGTITESGGAIMSLSSGTLSGVTAAAGTTLVTSGYAIINITNGLTVNGTVDLGTPDGSFYGTFIFAGSQTLKGTGTLLLGGSFQNTLEAQGTNNDTVPATLTIGSGITISGSSGQVDGYFPADSIINDGTVDASLSGGTITIDSGQTSLLTNNGTLEATSGTLDVGVHTITNGNSPWVNDGTLAVTGAGTLNLQGSFTTAGIGTFSRPGDQGTVNLAGFLNNAGATLALTSATGSWNSGGGTITGGTISETPGDLLVLTSLNGSGGLLSGVTIPAGSTLDVSQSNVQVDITNGITLNGTLDLGAASGSTYGTFIFQGNQTLSGTGTVQLGSWFQNTLEAQGDAGANPATLTIGSGITIAGGGVRITGYFPGDSIVNDGTVDANVAGSTVTVNGGGTAPFTNKGMLETTAGILNVSVRSGDPTANPWVNDGTLLVSGNGTLNLNGVFTPTDIGTFSRPGDQGTVNFAGFLNNASATLALNAATGSWNLAGGVITGGTITDTPGNLLVLTSLNGGGSTLSGVTIAAGATFDASQNNAQVAITGGMTLNGIIDLGSADGSVVDTLLFPGSQTLGGTGTVQLGGAANNRIESQGDAGANPATLTIGSGITIAGGTGQIIGYFPNDSFINRGTIRAGAGQNLVLNGDAWDNQGTIGVTGTGTLLLEGSFTDHGTFDTAGGLTYLQGTLNNAGNTLALNDATGTWYLFGGTIIGGTITTTGAGVLTGYHTDRGTIGAFNGVTLAGTLQLAQSVDRPSVQADLTITNGLTLNGGTIDDGGAGLLSFVGTQTLSGNGTINLTGMESGDGLQVPNAGDVLTIAPGVSVLGDSGAIGGNSLGAINNRGSIEAVNGGTLTVQNDTNFAAGTLSGGTWDAVGNSSLNLIGANITANAANLLLDGASSAIDSDTLGTNALAGLVTNTASGNLTVRNGAVFTSSASYTNAGSVTIGTGGKLVIGGAGVYTQSGGTTLLNGGTLGTSGNQIQINGGTLSGPGTIIGNLTNAGGVDLGPNPGVLTINGNFAQSAAGTLSIKVGGTTAGTQFDQVNVSGTATLGGTLAAQLINGFAPSVEESFGVLTFASSSGSLAKFNSPLIGGSAAFVTNSTPTEFDLVGVTAAPDLAISNVSFSPSSATVGQNITVNFAVKNLGTVATTAGSWTDSVYLSNSASLTPSATLLGRVTHTGDLSGLSSYTGMLTAPMPGVSGNNHIFVVADSGDVVPDVNRANNAGAAPTPLAVAVPLLTLGAITSGTIANRQELYYRLNVTPGSNVQLRATFAKGNQSGILVRFGALPTSGSFDESSKASSDLNPVVLFPSGQGGAYYIRLQGQSGAGAGQSFQLLADVVPFELSSFDTQSASNQGSASMNLVGSGFTTHTAVMLKETGNVITAASTTFINGNKLMATFDLMGQPAGTYNVVAMDGTQSSTAPATFQVTSQTANPNLNFYILVAHTGLPYQPFFVASGVINDGNTDVQIPEFELVAKNVNGYSEEDIPFLGGTLGPGQGVGPNLGPNGTAGNPQFTPSPDQPGTQSTFSLQAVPPTTTIDWSSLASMTPLDVPASAWSAVVANLATNLGTTVASMNGAFHADSIYLAQVGDSVTGQSALFSFEVLKALDSLPIATLAGATDSATTNPGLPLTFERAFSQSLVSRYTLGILGYGWRSNWDITATTDPSTGNVYIQQGAVTREFHGVSPGVYAGANGDSGVLSFAGGSYTLREIDGSLTSFLPDGQLGYIQDKLGDRITAAYTGGLLTSLTAGNGDQLTFTYNAQNLIHTVTNPLGQVTTYTYDTDAELTGVSNNQGTFQYAYISSPSLETAHDLTSITYPDGTHGNFDYDSQGRLIGRNGDGGTAAVTYAYLHTGGYTSTDAAGQTTTILYDAIGQTAVVKDPLGNVTEISHNADGQAVEISMPGGWATSTAYGTDGQLVSSVDPLGNATNYAYDPKTAALTSIQDANGNTTAYAYNAKEELTSITQPDGTAASYVHNSQGKIIESVDALGRTTHYTYDSQGRLALRTNPDSSSIAYGYNSNGDLTSVTDASGTITMTYDSSNNLTGITYPNGQYLKYSYAPGGRLTQELDQTGFAENYIYNNAGQLTEVTDASGQMVVSYVYDLVGRLSSLVNGNGTYATYTFDADGDLIHLINFAPDSSINSRFDYTYNALREMTSETTLAGTTTYAYDADGRLTSAVLPGGETITYAYDAAGNRTIVSDSGGMTTDYATNNLNQYTGVGGYTYTYDANGNLTVTGGPGGNTTYTYDTQNRLIGVQSPTDTYTYRYDALGDLLSSTDNGQITQYLVSPLGLGNVVAEYDGSGNLLANFAYGLGLVSQVTASGVHEYYDYNSTGSTVGLSGPAGTYLDTYTYLPFGVVKSATGSAANQFQYQGQSGVMAAGAGLDYMRSRFYSPANGRFINRDPAGTSGGINLYEYAANNPNSYMDPLGLGPMYYYGANPAVRYPALPDTVGNYPDVLSGLSSDSSYNASGSNLLAEFGQAENVNGAAVADAITSLSETSPTQLAQTGLDATNLAATDLAATDLAATQLASTELAAPPLDPATEVAVLAGAGGLAGLWALGGSNLAILAAGAAVDLIPPVALIAAAVLLIYEINGLYNDLNVPITTSATVFATASHTVVGPQDPNYVSGPGGFGSQGFISAGGALPYTVGFENESTATAPAHVVEVTEQIDPNLDWSTFQLGDFSFGGQVFSVPVGLTSYNTRLDEVASLGVYVDVAAEFDSGTGQLTWTFTTIDPTTLDDPVGNVFEGFLPPNVTAPQGAGFITYSVRPKAADATGNVIGARATVIFDAGLPDQTPLNTPSISNAIDSIAPTAAVLPLPTTETKPAFAVAWSGRDDTGGSGIASYTIYVSTDGGPPVPWLTNTTQTSAVFAGANGHSYAFFSQATDNVGNQEPPHATADATTTVSVPPAPVVGSFVVNDGATQRSMVTKLTVAFSTGVTLAANAITLMTRDGTAVPFQISTADGETYILTFTGSQFLAGSLADGQYVLTVHAAGVTDGFGQPMAADQSYSFFRLFGDYDGNGTVNSADYFQFKKAFGTSRGGAGYLSMFDYDGNGIINSSDYFQFKKRFGMKLV